MPPKQIKIVDVVDKEVKMMTITLLQWMRLKRANYLLKMNHLKQQNRAASASRKLPAGPLVY